MEIYPLGHSSFKIKGKQAIVVTDPYDERMMGMRFPKVEGVDIVTVSHDHADHNFVSAVGTGSFVVAGPGEYEIKGVTILGMATFHDATSGSERGTNTVYNLNVDNVKVCHLGDLGHKLTDEQVGQLGGVDVLLIPVGGFYTIDAKTAAEVVAQLEPRIVVPMHYRRSDSKSKVAEALAPVSDFLKEMGCEGLAPVAKLLTSSEKLPETTTVVVLE